MNMNMNRKCTVFMTALCLCALFTGCGRTKVNLNDYLSVDCDGYDTVGTASSNLDIEAMIKENPKAFGLTDSSSEMDALSVQIQLEEAISGELDKTSDLSNGDSVQYHWEISNLAALQENYPVSFSYEDQTYPVENLEKAEEFDPFDNLQVTFTGTAPYGQINMEVGSENVSNLVFHANPYENLKNGDKVTITADSSSESSTLEEICIQAGKIPTCTEKEYTVEGLTSYAAELKDIPEDMQEKMKNQAADALRSYGTTWEKDCTMQGEPEFVGYYFLTGKEGFSPSPYNDLYLVYKYTASINALKRGGSSSEKVQGEETYYTFYRYSDIQILGDGTCSVDLSSGQLCENSSESDYGYVNFIAIFYHFRGYRDIDSLFNACVTANAEQYNYESTVQ